jgi:hypothetical protein
VEKTSRDKSFFMRLPFLAENSFNHRLPCMRLTLTRNWL